MADTTADHLCLREIDNFSISHQFNTNRYVAAEAGRSRKRKQTHKPRQEQEIGDCQFIEVVIPLGVEDEVSIKLQQDDNVNTGESGEENVTMTPPDLLLPASPESETTSPFYDGIRTGNVPLLEYHRSMPRRSKSKRRKHMAGALGLTSSDLTQDVVMARKHNIHMKLRQGGILRFTMEEEFDVHSRAETYSADINPETSYYMIPSDKENINTINYSDIAPAARKRRKHLAIIDNFILISPLGRYCPEHDNVVTLPNGVKLLRPPTKLVELVAEAINDSPDGMLQVQQVYAALQNMYPFYRYMDKASLTSWRSSIRHALYQKWFKKIAFSTELINCKGCYWAINRKQKPKEWTMPLRREQQPLPMDYLSAYSDDADVYFLDKGNSIRDYSAAIMRDLTYDQDFDESGDELTETLGFDISPLKTEPSSPTSKTLDLPRDADPMFNTSMSQKSELQSYVAVASAIAESPDGSEEGTVSDGWSCDWQQPPSDDDSGYFGQVAWNAGLEERHHSLAYQAPLLPPTMEPYPIVPPLQAGYVEEEVELSVVYMDESVYLPDELTHSLP